MKFRNLVLSSCGAIWCAADAAVPSRAMKSAIRVNEVTSTSTARPAGTPRRMNWPICCQSGASMRCQMRQAR